MTRHSAYLALGLLLFVLLACNFSKNGNTSNQNAAKSESASESDAKVVGTFTNRRNIVNKYILVEKGISDDKLIEMAKKLHLAEPAVNFWFLDDDSKAEELVQWVGAYEKGEATLSDPIYDWMGDHIVANVQQYFGTGGTKYWALAKGMIGEQIEKLE